MDAGRRTALKSSSAAALLGALTAIGLVGPASAADWNKDAFAGKNLGESLKALGAPAPAQSGDIVITAPDIAENGAVVPVTVGSRLPNTEAIFVLVEKNPQPLAAGFDIPAGTEPSIATRVKMGETSNVHAVVKAGGRYYTAVKEIKVTLGGCGG